jgi:hypothetical protein
MFKKMKTCFINAIIIANRQLAIVYCLVPIAN